MIKIDKTFLRSKVARRVFTLFIFCALVPISALAVISFNQVSKQLIEQGKKRLNETCKHLSMSVIERMLFLENDLILISSKLDEYSKNSGLRISEAYQNRIKYHFKTLDVSDYSGNPIHLLSKVRTSLDQIDIDEEQLSMAKTIILSRYEQDNDAHPYIIRAIDSKHLEKGIIFGEINIRYLFGMDDSNTLPGMTEICVLDEKLNVLFSSHQVFPSFHKKLAREMLNSEKNYLDKGWFEWKLDNKAYLANFQTLFLKSCFNSSNWTLVVSTSKDDIFAPVADYKYIFPLVILLSLLVVLLLSVIQIRKTMDPLEKLKEGTQYIAMKDFKRRIVINSGDEFEELGSSFNHMAQQLDRQFNALTTMAEIDYAILSSLDTEKIIDTVINRMHEIFSCDFVGILLFDFQNQDSGQLYLGATDTYPNKSIEHIEIQKDEMQKLIDNPEIMVIEGNENLPHYLKSFASKRVQSSILLPLFINQKLSGIMAIGKIVSYMPNEDDLLHLRQLADQVAVALSNANLIEALDKFNWGTLKALARTVDTKSSWTAGHSERVTELALKIGKALKLSQKELDNLQRGGLLHDIGKLGVPIEILDKPGRLTEEEFEIIKQHPITGARILEPISAYEDVIPIGLQHHERFDGTGYPYGISGEEICLGARIMAVADVYDALISDRPYRAGIEKKRALEIIKKEAGERFDPKVVNAFSQVIEKEEGKKEIVTDQKKKIYRLRDAITRSKGIATKTI